MFILDTNHVPATSAELSAAIAASLQKWMLLPGDSNPVRITGNMPKLSTMTIDVSGGKIASARSLPFEITSGELQTGPTANAFTLLGHPVSVAEIPIQLDLTAACASFAYARNPSRQLIATLQDASQGRLSIHLSQTDLNNAAIKLARRLAGDSVTVQTAEVALTSMSTTVVEVMLTITAKKFVTAIIRVSGQIAIDDQMIATAANLRAAANGVVGNIAVNLLQHHLQKLQDRPLPLLAFSLGNVKLHGVEIHTADGLQITADFGS